jgi:hypothetical protein
MIGFGTLTPPDEVLALLALAREVLVRDYAGVMIAIVDETAEIVRDGHAARQCAYAVSNGRTADLCGDCLSGRVHSLCADLLWDVAPTTWHRCLYERRAKIIPRALCVRVLRQNKLRWVPSQA